MSISETQLFTDQSLSFSCCGRPSSQAEIMYACVAPHIHPGDKGAPLFTTVSLDKDCNCGHCCSCYAKSERTEQGILVPEEITGFLCVLCKDCMVPKPCLRKKKVYQYCFFCITLQNFIKCLQCGEILKVNCSYFYDFEEHSEQCSCGKINHLKDYPFDLTEFLK